MGQYIQKFSLANSLWLHQFCINGRTDMCSDQYNTILFQLMEVGVIMGTGQHVQRSVVEAPRPDPGHAATLPLLTVEQLVREMPWRYNLATSTLVLV